MEDEYSIQQDFIKSGVFGNTYVMKIGKTSGVLLRVSGLTSNTAEDDLVKMKDLKHPNILRLLDYNNDKETKIVFVVNELCSHTLRYTLQFPETKKNIQLFAQMANGLEFLHSKNILHRDLRPENIFVRVDGHVKLGNIGYNREQELMALKRSYNMSEEYNKMTIYVGPEMFRSSGSNYSKATDIWSLGCIFYEVCTEAPAFTYSTLYLLKNEEPPSISIFKGVKKLRKIVKDMLKKDPEVRPNAATVKAQLLDESTINLATKDTVVDITPNEFYWGKIATIVRQHAEPRYDPQYDKGIVSSLFSKCSIL